MRTKTRVLDRYARICPCIHEYEGKRRDEENKTQYAQLMETPPRINDYKQKEHFSKTHINVVLRVAQPQIVQNGGLGQFGHFDHVFARRHRGRVHLAVLFGGVQLKDLQARRTRAVAGFRQEKTMM